MGYEPSKTVIKGFWIFAYGGIGSVIAFLGQLPADQAGPAIVVIASVLKMLENFIKHAGK